MDTENSLIKTGTFLCSCEVSQCVCGTTDTALAPVQAAADNRRTDNVPTKSRTDS